MYVARFTNNPKADIKRGWSGWMGVTYSSLKSAASELLPDLDTSEMTEDEISDALDNAGFDVRFDSELGEYRPVHHNGLSCFALEATTLEDALTEQHPDAIGEGYRTVGTVRLVAAVPGDDGWYIFECDNAIPEY